MNPIPEILAILPKIVYEEDKLTRAELVGRCCKLLEDHLRDLKYQADERAKFINNLTPFMNDLTNIQQIIFGVQENQLPKK